MAKKKSAATPKKAEAKKSDRVKAATAANPVPPADVARPPAAPKAAPANPAPQAGAQRLPFRKPQNFMFAGVDRNDVCPCGSGKRFKNCHGR